MSVNGGDIIYAADLNTLLNAPIGRIVASGTQVLADNTQVAVQFSGTDDIDTHGFHNPASNNTRITPTVAGYYRFTGMAFFEGQTTPGTIDASFRLNGSTNLAPAWRGPGSTLSMSGPTTVLQLMNGSTDYVELMARQDSAGADNTNQSSQFSSVVEWELVRPA